MEQLTAVAHAMVRCAGRGRFKLGQKRKEQGEERSEPRVEREGERTSYNNSYGCCMLEKCRTAAAVVKFKYRAAKAATVHFFF